MKHTKSMLVRVAGSPKTSIQLSEEDWDLLIRQARRANLLSRLATIVADEDLLESVPEAPKAHLVSAQRVAARQDMTMRWEVHCIQEALSSLQVPIVLLKGASYLMSGLPTSRGRVFSDIDILIPKQRLAEVENSLMIHGWHGMTSSSYDQRYYRSWMHELPPMQHIHRGTVIDVHHSILPETARIKINTPALWEGLVPVAGHQNLFVLNPLNMVLHSATHLFHEGELHNGLRDLFDLDSQLRDFGTNANFWNQLPRRACNLGLERPLYYALHYTKLMLDTPIPDSVFDSFEGKPSAPISGLMDLCYLRALLPMHATCSDRWTPLARLALFVRSHWIKMPFFLLIYHLARKALVREGHEASENAGKEQPG